MRFEETHFWFDPIWDLFRQVPQGYARCWVMEKPRRFTWKLVLRVPAEVPARAPDVSTRPPNQQTNAPGGGGTPPSRHPAKWPTHTAQRNPELNHEKHP